MTTTATALGPSLGAAPDSPGLVAWYAEGFSDRLGDRLLLFDNAGPALELLRFHDEIALQPGFEAALRSRVDALAQFRHPLFTRVRSVTHLENPRPQLALVSELPSGERLSTLLRAVELAGHRPDPGATVWLLRQILPALTALHESGPRTASGLVTPERIFVGPDGTLTLTEYTLSDALVALGWTPVRLWTALGVSLRPGRRAEIDARSDVSQLALVALALLKGRVLSVDDIPISRNAIEQACDAWRSARTLGPWLTRALVPGEHGFISAREALAALDELVPGVMGIWSPTLLPNALPPAPEVGTALVAGERSVVPALPGIRNLESSDEIGDVARVPAPLVRFLGASISVGRLWRINGVLALVVCVEALALATFFMRVGTGNILVAPVVRAAPTAAQAPVVPMSIPAATIDLAPTVPAAPTGPAASTVPRASAASVLAAAKAVEPSNLRPQAAISPVIGWLQVEAPVPVKVYANGRLLGTGTSSRFRLPAGRHLITLANEEQGLRSTQPVEIAGGRTVLVALDAAPHSAQ